MTTEQFEKLYNLLSLSCTCICITMVFVFFICGIYIINTYYDDKEKKDKLDIIKRDKEIRDKCYLSSLEHRIRKLENKDD